MMVCTKCGMPMLGNYCLRCLNRPHETKGAINACVSNACVISIEKEEPAYCLQEQGVERKNKSIRISLALAIVMLIGGADSILYLMTIGLTCLFFGIRGLINARKNQGEGEHLFGPAIMIWIVSILRCIFA